MDKELTIEQKLRMLYDLQLIDSRIDQIRAIQGELPIEVQDLEDEVAGLETRLGKLREEKERFEGQIAQLKNTIVESREAAKKYEAQQKNVRNNREYDAISKEIEYQELEIQHAEKLIKESSFRLESQGQRIAETEEKLHQMQEHLGVKKTELDGIMAETQREEKALEEKSRQMAAQIEERLLSAYRKIRARVRNGLAVVSIDRGASEGSFFTIPAQRQLEIAMRKKIITDENSGRILVDHELAMEEKKKMEEIFNEITGE